LINVTPAEVAGETVDAPLPVGAFDADTAPGGIGS